jgi:hypothetical protein
MIRHVTIISNKNADSHFAAKPTCAQYVKGMQKELLKKEALQYTFTMFIRFYPHHIHLTPVISGSLTVHLATSVEAVLRSLSTISE